MEELTVRWSSAEIQKRYALGEREFKQAQLRKVDLKELDLSHANLSGADLSYADLSRANLSDADLQEAYLNGSVLEEAKLRETNLSEAYLTRANLKGAELVKANLQEAKLNGAVLEGANLTEAKLNGAYLIKANFSGANLNAADLSTDLSGVELEGAYYSDRTAFEPGFDPIGAGMQKSTTMEALLSILNYLYQCSQHYLGDTLTASYLKSACPDFDWLNQFQINRSKQITFAGTLSDPATPLQLQQFQEWIDAFIGSCSQIVQDFPATLDRGRLTVAIAAPAST